MRAAYRKKGWALSNADHVEQCAHDTYLDAIKEQKGEGCKMWGFIEVGDALMVSGGEGRRGLMTRSLPKCLSRNGMERTAKCGV